MYINKKVNLKYGGRTIGKISPEDFIIKSKDFINKNNENFYYMKYDENDVNDVCEALAFTIMSLYSYNSNYYICKDFKNIKFDNENTEVIKFHDENEYPYIVASSGGDWEIPVIFIIYWDGKKIRVYIPKKGNTWRFDTKSALGNYDGDESYPSDEKYVYLHSDEHLYNYDDDEDEEYVDICDVDYDLESCIEDFEARVNYPFY